MTYKEARRKMWSFTAYSVMLGIMMVVIYTFLSLQLWMITTTPAEWRWAYIMWLGSTESLWEWIWITANIVFWTAAFAYCVHRARRLRRLAKQLSSKRELSVGNENAYMPS
jgi:hypothetical protein